jgi:hypothetical protein
VQAAWMGKCAHVLAARDLPAPAAEVLAALPSVPQLIDMCLSLGNWSWLNGGCNAWWNVFLAIASVYERLKQHEKVLLYTEAAMGPLAEAGSQLPSLVILCWTMQGRAYAGLGRMGEAGRAFERAVDEAHVYGLALFEMQALRDLKLLVLDGMGSGEGEHGSRRLGAALRQLVSPADKLTPMLKGLDAAELMRLAAPDSSYRVVHADAAAAAESQQYPEMELHNAARKAELEAMSVLALHKRAMGAGLDVTTTLKNAMSSPSPKQELVRLLLQ